MKSYRPHRKLPGSWIPEVRECDVEALKKLLIEGLGPDVSLANVAPEDLLDLETTRVGPQGARKL